MKQGGSTLFAPDQREEASRSAPETAAHRLHMVEVGVVVVVALVAAFLGWGLSAGWLASPGASAPDDGSETPGRADVPAAYFSLDGEAPQAYPDTRLAVGFLNLDDTLGSAIDALGPFTTAEPDIFGTAYTWAFPGGASLLVSADDNRTIAGVLVVAPVESASRFSAFGGVVIGTSTLRDVVAAWGSGYVPAEHPEDDFSISYVECAGPYPVIVKFDQAARTQDSHAPEAGSLLWDMPVTTLMVAYADEPAGSSGCPAPAASAGSSGAQAAGGR